MKPKVDYSGYNNSKIGERKKVGKKEYELGFKAQISVDQCPKCKSDCTFHKMRMEDREKQFVDSGRSYENCYGMSQTGLEPTITFSKYDLCLDCGNTWPFEIFCWELVKWKPSPIWLEHNKVKKK